MENKFIRLFLWVIITILLFTGITELMTTAAFMANMFGILLIGLWVYISIKTKLFLDIHIKKHGNKK